MKTSFFTLVAIVLFSLQLSAGETGKIIIRSGDNSCGAFIASVNGIRLNARYANMVACENLDECSYRIKIRPEGGRQLLSFDVAVNPGYVNAYVLYKRHGQYQLLLENSCAMDGGSNYGGNNNNYNNNPATCEPPRNTYLPPAIDFKGAADAIERESFESTRFEMAKTLFAQPGSISSAQVASLLSLFSFESTKLDFAKYAYPRTSDKANYFKVFDSFSFSSSKKELAEFMRSR